jgi:hypothetical protein
MKIRYMSSLDGIEPNQLRGFFAGWPNPPSPETHLRILRGSQHLVLAVDDTSGRVVGFVTALTDGVCRPTCPCLKSFPSTEGTALARSLCVGCSNNSASCIWWI